MELRKKSCPIWGYYAVCKQGFPSWSHKSYFCSARFWSNLYLLVIFLCLDNPSGPRSSPYRSFEITLRQTTLGRNLSGRVVSPTQRPLTENKHSQQTDIRAPGRIRTRNPNKRAEADPRLRQRCHQVRLFVLLFCLIWAWRKYALYLHWIGGTEP